MRLSLIFIIIMFVCICKGLTEKQLNKAIEEIDNFHGYVNLELVQKYTYAATNCGCCIEEILEIINEFQNAKNNIKVLA